MAIKNVNAETAILNACTDFETFVRELFATERCDGSDQRQVATAILLLRVLEFHASVLDLLRAGRLTTARVVVRAAFDAAVTSRAINRSRELFSVWAQQGAKKQAKAIRRGRTLKNPRFRDLKAAADSAPLEDLAAKAREIPSLTVECLARAAGMSEVYVTVYSLLSESVHSSVLELRRHADVSEAGELRNLLASERTDDIEMLAGICSNMLWAAADATFISFGKPAPAALEARMQAIRDMVDGLAH